MKFVAALFLALLLAAPGRAQTRENPYDVLGKTLEPIIGVTLPKSPLRGLVLDAHLLSASRLPAQFQGQSIHLALNPPDRLLLSAPIAGEMLTVCRDADDLWATPGSKIQYLIDQAAGATPAGTPVDEATPSDQKPKKKKKKHSDKLEKDAAAVLGPLRLPIPDNQLVFLPVLFEVADAGDAQIGATTCRVLDVRLMPQLAQSLHVESWSARLWVTADYKPAQIEVTGPNWDATAAIDKLELSPSLPDAAFQTADPDVLHLTPAQFVQLVERLGTK